MRIVFLASGNGGNLKFVSRACDLLGVPGVELFVVADRACGAIEFAARARLPHQVIGYSRQEPGSLRDALETFRPDLVVTNWNKIIDAGTVALYVGKLINLHYSLLPSFAGFTGIEPLRQAFERGCGYVGATCHFVDEGVDTGRIVGQTIVPRSVGLDRAVELVFRQGAMILLDTLLKLSGMATEAFAGSERPEFSPALAIDPSAFDEAFWQGVAKA